MLDLNICLKCPNCVIVLDYHFCKCGVNRFDLDKEMKCIVIDDPAFVIPEACPYRLEMIMGDDND